MQKKGAFAEIEALQAVMKALDGLSDEAVARILNWAASHHSGSISTQSVLENASKISVLVPSSGAVSANPAPLAMSTFRDAADLVSRMDLRTGADRALAIAYWLQVCKGLDGFDGYSVNKELKDLGYRLSNVTVTLGGLMSQRPALVIQVKKSGSSRQARKIYRLTREGISRAEKMLHNGRESDDS